VAVDEDDIDLEDINMEDFEDNENADDVEIPDAPKEEIKVQSVLDLVPEQREVAAVEKRRDCR